MPVKSVYDLKSVYQSTSFKCFLCSVIFLTEVTSQLHALVPLSEDSDTFAIYFNNFFRCFVSNLCNRDPSTRNINLYWINCFINEDHWQWSIEREVHQLSCVQTH